jgi:hypothetical protein
MGWRSWDLNKEVRSEIKALIAAIEVLLFHPTTAQEIVTEILHQKKGKNRIIVFKAFPEEEFKPVRA